MGFLHDRRNSGLGYFQVTCAWLQTNPTIFLVGAYPHTPSPLFLLVLSAPLLKLMPSCEQGEAHQRCPASLLW